MNEPIHRLAIQLSNNSQLTTEVSVILSKLTDEEKATVRVWLRHALSEQDIKVSQAKRKF